MLPIEITWRMVAILLIKNNIFVFIKKKNRVIYQKRRLKQISALWSF